MQLETKKLTNTEMVLFFQNPLAIQGTFYQNKSNDSHFEVLENISAANLSEQLLLTSDFIYLKSLNPTELDDLVSLACAELDDYTSIKQEIKYASNENATIKIKILLRTVIAPMLQQDGGDIEFSEYENGIVKVRFLGKCQGCPYAQRTLKGHVEKNLIRYLPEIREVILV